MQVAANYATTAAGVPQGGSPATATAQQLQGGAGASQQAAAALQGSLAAAQGALSQHSVMHVPTAAAYGPQHGASAAAVQQFAASAAAAAVNGQPSTIAL